MNAIQRNRLAMFMAVKNVFGTYPAELSLIKALEGFIVKFNELIAQIEAVHQIQQGNTTGARQLKLKEEAEMIEATVKLAATMYVYAQVNDMPDLQAKCAVSASQMERMSDQKVKATCLNVYHEAITLGDVLSDYGQTVEDVTQLKKEIDDFSAIIASPRSAIVTRSQATKELDCLMREANDLLRDKIDKLMELLKTKEPKVYNTYLAARVIVDLRAGIKVVEEE
ncbi:hypothetical protein J1N10_02580 [Carboxylicivirga sp. A043]|uniref:hypothetical protein n=1 Tax=Carboxylicivirga litoralis TaxID=2816963 RepID=UPI0021CB4FB7|nr:hypothetical protein [Carboxylicivirga sp. A043]MCU4154844.1 hypothetical protein [Carboxylicivirga sp. A043]